jgi:16S rRNA (adenine1518-N6/adenine1519-N6)-dimethyltransferase
MSAFRSMEKEGFRPPRKSLGQNFLHQKGVIDSIISAFDPLKSDTVVEIGPGRGALTFPLLEKVANLHVVEVDPVLADYWSDLAIHRPNLTVHHIDALDVDLTGMLGKKAGLRVIGNLPYNISSPILFHLLSQTGVIRDMLLMFQLEVAQRLVSPPGSRRYGRLSVMVQQRCEIETVLKVSPGSFVPAPKVDSAVVRLVPRSDPAVNASDETHFSNLVRAAFSMRRKTLRNSLRSLMDDTLIREAGVSAEVRAEQLTVQEFVALMRVYVDNMEKV